VGWAGQTLADMSGSRVPWFGRGSRGKGHPGSPGGGRGGGGGRGRGGADCRGGRRLGRRGWGAAGGGPDSAGALDGISVDELVALVRAQPRDQALPDMVFQARAGV